MNSSTIIGAGGELSDFQYLLTLLEDLTTDDFRMDDGVELQPKEIFSWLTRVLYNRRTKWVSLEIAHGTCKPDLFVFSRGVLVRQI